MPRGRRLTFGSPFPPPPSARGTRPGSPSGTSAAAIWSSGEFRLAEAVPTFALSVYGRHGRLPAMSALLLAAGLVLVARGRQLEVSGSTWRLAGPGLAGLMLGLAVLAPAAIRGVPRWAWLLLILGLVPWGRGRPGGAAAAPRGVRPPPRDRERRARRRRARRVPGRRGVRAPRRVPGRSVGAAHRDAAPRQPGAAAAAQLARLRRARVPAREARGRLPDRDPRRLPVHQRAALPPLRGRDRRPAERAPAAERHATRP